MSEFKPFADDTGSMEVGGLTVENGTARISVYGNMEASRDAEGAERLRRLAALFEAAAKVAESSPALKEEAEATVGMKNPFA